MEIKKWIAILSLLLFATGSYLVKTGKLVHHSSTVSQTDILKSQD